MTGNWSDGKPTTPDRVKGGARAAVGSLGSSKAAVIVVVVVAVVLIGTLVWATTSLGATDSEADPKPAADDVGSEEPTLTELPTDGTYQIHQGDDECLRLSDSDDGYDRTVVARGDCEADVSHFIFTLVEEDVYTIGVAAAEFAEGCLRADGPEAGGEPSIFYYGPAECDPDDELQRFRLLPGYYGTLRIQSEGEQCMDVFVDFDFADGKVVATANCSDSATQPMRLRPV